MQRWCSSQWGFTVPRPCRFVCIHARDSRLNGLNQLNPLLNEWTGSFINGPLAS